MTKAISSISAVLTALLFAAPSLAWTPASMTTIGEQAARLAPPDLHRQLARNRESYRIGLAKPFELTADLRVKNEDGNGRLDVALKEATQMAIKALREHRPMNEVAYRMGVAVHLMAMANWPPATSGKDRDEDRYGADFARYAEAVEPRLRLVFYGFRPGSGKADEREVPLLLGEALARSRRFYPLVGLEYRRIGFAAGKAGFDDRSTAYAITSLGYSHAVSDSAEVLRYIWLAAGGGDTRTRLPLRGQELVQLNPIRPKQPTKPSR